jgi:hypothetical protein
MGTLVYDGTPLDFEDRLLAHLQIVIVQKLRHDEGFTMSWLRSLSIGDGRTSIWLDRTISLRFEFDGSRSPSINRDWLRQLQESANGSTGLVVTGEDGQLARCGGARR